ncbi:hypothetical protein KUW09_01870 [Mameliella alba]|nr:hypothetical protein [Antarctobacter heliothermus]MBY6142767.1 hypothetical protein [Mameliella alba]MBY6159622.1 hypothetical protein [Mameliella alba]MBY6168093.1 hypothetical protein [Mameliella alba]MBY6173114.1 hypothetical protein [Mameliella alba]
MKRPALLIAALSVLGLAGCEPPDNGTYPVSHESCAPDDPVKDLDPVDCAPRF